MVTELEIRLIIFSAKDEKPAQMGKNKDIPELVLRP